MRFSELYNYPQFHAHFTPSRVKQTASRITQMDRLGNYSAKVEAKDAALFLYVLAASQGTRFVFDTVMHERELIDAKGNCFVSDLAELLTNSTDLFKVKKVVIGSTVSIIEFRSGHKDLYTKGNDYELGKFESFDTEFLQDLSNAIAVTELAA